MPPEQSPAPSPPASALHFLSVFAGIGGIDLGLERSGMRCVGQVEIDPFCRAVLTKHWPDVWRHDDVRTLTPEMVREHCGDVDLIAGGFPCQGISNAGQRAGLSDTRSGLWGEFVRLVRGLRPGFVFVENVRALLIRGFDRVLGDLADSGYDAEWDRLPAAAVGAPHFRDRVLIVAYPARVGSGEVPVGQLVARGERDASVGPSPAGSQARTAQVLADTGREGLSVSKQATVFGAGRRDEGGAVAECGWWATEPDVGRVAHVVPSRVDRLRGLGNAVVPQVAEYIGRLIVAADAPARAAGGKGKA